MGWEQTRELVFAISAPHLDRKYKDITKQEFMPFNWDEQPKQVPKQTAKQKAEMFKKWDKLEFKKQ